MSVTNFDFFYFILKGCSEESGPSIEDSELNPNATSITDIDVQYRLETPVISISNAGHRGHRSSVSGYQLSPHMRCRACRSCERRASTTPVSSFHLARSISRESVRSNAVHLSPISPNMQYKHIPPPVLITGSPTSGSRIIRQSSQPEASSIICCGGHSNACIHSQTAPSVSLRQLREPSEGIAGIGTLNSFHVRFGFILKIFWIYFMLNSGWFIENKWGNETV